MLIGSPLQLLNKTPLKVKSKNTWGNRKSSQQRYKYTVDAIQKYPNPVVDNYY